MTSQMSPQYEASKKVYEVLQEMQKTTPKGFEGIMHENLLDILDGHGMSAYDFRLAQNKAIRGLNKVKGMLNNGKDQIGILALEAAANFYSNIRLYDPNSTPEQRLLFATIAAGTLLDTGLRLGTGNGIETYLKAGIQIVYDSIKQRINKDID